jgi:hypothetical protein
MRAHAGTFAGLTRGNLHQYLRRQLRPGGGTRPALLLLQHDGARAVLKDFHAASWFLRAFVGPWLVRREARVYRSLAGAPGVPRLIGLLDRHALLVEHIEGRNCAQYADGELPPGFFDRLLSVVQGIHARGVVHCDIKNRSNIVVADGGHPYIVDFASAFTRDGPFASLRRLPFERFRTDDLRGVIKAKLLAGQLWNKPDADFAFRRDPFERMVRAVRDAARWTFRLFAGGGRARLG